MAAQEMRFGIDDQPKVSNGKGRIFTKRYARPQLYTMAIGGEAKNKPSKIKAEKPIIVMAIDCGMTYSGGGFCAETSNPEYVSCNKQWPGSIENHSKIPTVIAYRAENSGHEAFRRLQASSSMFGYEVQLDMSSHAFFKTCVDDKAERTVFDDSVMDSEAADALLKVSKGRVGIRAIEDSLRHMRLHLIDKLIDEMGDDTLDKYDLKFVVTHPAACSDEGRATMHNAAKAAGFIRPNAGDSIMLKSEPEAACLASFMINRRKFGSAAWVDAYKAKCAVAVADLGGLTFDVTVLRVHAVEPHLRLQQICAPQGGRCGTTALYCRLWQHVSAMFGDAFTSLPIKSRGHGSPFLADFERELRKFDGRDLEKEVHLRLMIENFKHERYDDVDAMVIVTRREIKAMMDATLTYLKTILDEQIEAAKAEDYRVKSIVFCGGGSCFPYFVSQLKRFCGEPPLDIKQFVRPEDPQSVVATGALIAGLKERIMGKRKCRAWYGIKCHKALGFESREKWNEADIFECPYGGTRVDGFMKWHIRKGDIIDPSQPGVGKTIHGYTMIDLDDLDNDATYPVTIYFYMGDDEPERVDHPGVRSLGSFQVKPSSMSGTRKARLRRMRAVEESSKVDMKMVQLSNIETGLIMFEARVGNTKVGKYQLEFDATTQI